MAEKERMGAAGDGPDLAPLTRNGCAVAGDARRLEAQTDETAPRPLLLHLDQRRPAAELAFVQLHDPAEAGLVWVHRLVHVVPVQAQGGFEPCGVSSAEPR